MGSNTQVFPLAATKGHSAHGVKTNGDTQVTNSYLEERLAAYLCQLVLAFAIHSFTAGALDLPWLGGVFGQQFVAAPAPHGFIGAVALPVSITHDNAFMAWKLATQRTLKF